MKKLCVVVGLLSSVLCPLLAAAQAPQLINYQGRLLSGTNLVNGNIGLSLRLFDANTSGTLLYEDSNTVAVADGLYSTFLGDDSVSGSLTNALAGTNVWIEVAVNGSALTPRERLVSAAYAVKAQHALVFTGSVLDSQLSANIARLNGTNQTFSGPVNFSSVSNTFTGSFSGNGLGVTNVSLESVRLDQPSVIAWGYNGSGQTNVPATATGVVAVASGFSHNLAVRVDGSVIAWGNNANGQANVPATATGVVSVAGGAAHSLAARANGSVIAWGANIFGQTNVPASATDVVAVAAGNSHSLALRADGTVIAWGAGTNDLNDTVNEGQSIVPAGATGVVAIAGGGLHSMALRADGTVIAWGNNGSGQLLVPSTATGVVAVAAGNSHSLALRADGTVIAWGNNGDGQCVVPANATGVVSIAAGWYHSLAARADGTVIAWGAGTSDLNNNLHEGQSIVPAGATGVVQVAAGQLFSLALRVDRIRAQIALLDRNNTFAGTVTAQSFVGNGAGLTNITAGSLASSLSTNLARLSGTNQTFSGPVSFISTSNTFVGTISGNGAGLTNVDLRAVNTQGAIGWATNWGNFVLASSPVVGQTPYSVAMADVNGDGKVDLISVNSSAETLSVLTNNGSGGFSGRIDYSVGNTPRSVAAADVNGDGKVDLISANYDDTTLSVLTNNGSGGFTLASSPGAGFIPTCLAAADVNGDGKIDLITGNNYLSPVLLVLTNNGNGIFSSNATYAVGANPTSVAAADVNGDGYVDLISAIASASALTVMTNNGSGRFSSNASYAVGPNPTSVAAADVNGDGDVDLISAIAGASALAVMTNNGSGGFSLASSPGVGSLPISVAAADVNGDGKVDLISANSSADTLSVLTNNGSGGFSGRIDYSAGDGPQSVAAADVNADGKVDLVGANLLASTLSVFFNTQVLSGKFIGDGSGLVGITGASLVGGTISNAALAGEVLTNIAARADSNLVWSTFATGAALSNSVASLTTNISARLDSNVWAAADSTTNYTRRTGGTNSGPLTIGTRTGVVDAQVVSLRVVGSNNVNWKGAAAFGHTNASVIVGELSGVATVGGHNAALSAWSALSLNPGGGNVGIGTLTPTGLLHVAGNAYAQAWLTTSDRNAKQDIAPVDAAAILEKISALPVASWSFKTEPGVKHIGPMAQDFRAAFGLGPNDISIATVDADGVALAAIQALNKKLDELKAENAELKKQNEEILQRLRANEAK